MDQPLAGTASTPAGGGEGSSPQPSAGSPAEEEEGEEEKDDAYSVGSSVKFDDEPLSIDELQELCRNRGIIPMPTSTRDELIQLLEEHESPPGDDFLEEDDELPGRCGRRIGELATRTTEGQGNRGDTVTRSGGRIFWGGEDPSG